MRWCGMVAACTVMLGALGGCARTEDFQPFDSSRVILLQLEPLVEGEDIAILKTDYGEIRMRFFPSEAPEAVSNFKTLARQGFYNGKPFLQAQTLLKDGESCLLSGSSSADGKRGISAVNGGKPFKKEVSVNLWHFTGAVSVLGDRNDKGDSRFFITGSRAVPENTLADIEKARYPSNVIEAFEKQGGMPEFALEYAIFAQIYEGQEAVDSILAELSAGEEQEIVLQTVEISEYGDG